ncbi:hypothetical protein DH2020_000145 [Rehmannia glutinosa]|uniref:Uncharacterized protein n=1 Tax=Rehmannia glutinosa TaxID=99300 RepID=A0ABR0XVN7_REHGL
MFECHDPHKLVLLICGSSSSFDSDDLPEYYQPISTVDNGGSGEDEDEDEEGDFSDQNPSHNFHQLPNGWTENGVSSLDLIDEDEEEEEMATESESAIERAFREDERRRNAPLPAENAVRVMEAMRRVSFGGSAPDWAGQVPDDQWIDRLRRMRRPTSGVVTAASATTDH